VLLGSEGAGRMPDPRVFGNTDLEHEPGAGRSSWNTDSTYVHLPDCGSNRCEPQRRFESDWAGVTALTLFFGDVWRTSVGMAFSVLILGMFVSWLAQLGSLSWLPGPRYDATGVMTARPACRQGRTGRCR
jgi:hypothetical protein